MWSAEYKEHYKKTFLLAYPVCLSQLGHIMVGVVDTAMVGFIGTNEQAAVSLANSLYTIILVFGIGVSIGVTPMIAISDSQKDLSQSSILLINSLVLNIFVGISLFILLYFISPVLHILGQPSNVVELAIPFLNVIMLSMVPLSIFLTFKQFTEGLSYTRFAMIITVSANLLNIALNYILIFGKLGFSPMGLMGSCWASFISRMMMAVSMFLYVYLGKSFKTYWNFFSLKEISFKEIRKILTIGIPVALQRIFEVGIFSISALMIGWIGAKELAAHQIALSVAAMTYMVASGLEAAAMVRVGNYFGLANTSALRKAGYSAFVMVIIFMLFCAILFIFGKNLIPTFFTFDEEVIFIASTLLIIAAFFQLSDGLQVVALGALRGMKDVRVPTFITLAAYWAIGLPSGYILAFIFGLGARGVWYGFVIGLSAAAVFLFLRFNYLSKRFI